MMDLWAAKRLGAVASHVVAAEQPQQPPAERLVLPHRLEQADDGTLLPAEVAMLESLEAEAAARRDYRRAGQLRDTLEALTPARPPLSLAACSPHSPEEQRDFFWENGFCATP